MVRGLMDFIPDPGEVCHVVFGVLGVERGFHPTTGRRHNVAAEARSGASPEHSARGIRSRVSIEDTPGHVVAAVITPVAITLDSNPNHA